MRSDRRIRERLLREWGRYVYDAAGKGSLTGQPVHLRIEGIAGPRAGALEVYAGMEAAKLLRVLSRSDAALLRQFVPWSFTGQPAAYMHGRFVRLEAGWPGDLAETMIRLGDLGQHPKYDGKWIAGKNETGATVVMGFNDRTPHFLVSGATGSGKTVALRSAVLQLSHDSTNLLVLVDGKFGEGLGILAHLPGVIGPVAADFDTARAALGWAATEMRQRYESQRRRGRVVIIIDEFQEWADDAVFVDLLRKLASQGRAAQVHLLAATQHPTVEAFGHPAIRRSLTGKLAMKVTDSDASRVAVGGALPRADYLLGAGDAYAVGLSVIHRMQVAFVDERDINDGGSGQWRFDEWPEYSAERVGQNLPQKAGWSYSSADMAVSIISATLGEGRPSLVHRLEAVGLGRPGSNRAARLLTLGREVRGCLKDSGYEVVSLEGGSPDSNARLGDTA